METKAIYTFMHDYNGDTFMSAKKKLGTHEKLIGTWNFKADEITRIFSVRLEDCLRKMNSRETLVLEATLKND